MAGLGMGMAGLAGVARTLEELVRWPNIDCANDLDVLAMIQRNKRPAAMPSVIQALAQVDHCTGQERVADIIPSMMIGLSDTKSLGDSADTVQSMNEEESEGNARIGKKRGRRPNSIDHLDEKHKRNTAEKLRIKKLAESVAMIREELCRDQDPTLASKLRRLPKQAVLDFTLEELKSRNKVGKVKQELTLEQDKGASSEASEQPTSGQPGDLNALQKPHANNLASDKMLPVDTVFSQRDDLPAVTKADLEGPLPFLLLHMTGRIVAMNPAFWNLSGFSMNEKPSLLELIVPEQIPQTFRLLAELSQQNDKNTATFKSQWVTRSLVKVDVNATLTLARDSSEGPAFMTLTATAM